MPFRAVSFGAIHFPAFASRHIFSMRYRPKVGWINTATHIANVVYLFSFWNRPMPMLKSYSMACSFRIKSSIAIRL